MTEPFVPIITTRYGLENSHTLEVAQKAGAYEQAKKALLTMAPEAIREEVKKANLRGRGGAGFAMGVKWGFLAPKPGDEVYLVVNGDESEPGTFKDRTIMSRDPHRVIEGVLITCYAIGAHKAFIYVRGELERCIERLRAARLEVQPGTRYFYVLDGERRRPDPASRAQPEGVHGPSQVIDPSAFR